MRLPNVPVQRTHDIERRHGQAINQLVNRSATIRTISGAATLDSRDDIILANAAAGPITVTLPKAGAFKGRQFIIKKVDASANAVTVDGNGAETIDGAATQAISTQWEALLIVSDGAGWVIV